MARSVSELCQAVGLTIEQLVERSSLERGRVEAILLGRWTPSPEERRRIAEAIGISIDEVAWGHVTPIQHLYGHGPG